ncbi:MAG: Asp23/Gls24 family envelope stress response protein [Phascolarctobacterium sp.]|nr:Asp23/Gls24 family envelope stress response protein [Phascolarctobacterium sp.]
MDEINEKLPTNEEIVDEPQDLEEMGDIRIADDVIGIVASLACQEVPGVICMAGGITDGLNSLIGKENASKGIRLKFDKKTVTANVYVIVEYGCYIPEVALAIQEKVKEAIEEMTRFDVQFVDVHIQGVQRRKAPEFAKEAEAEENMADIVRAQTMHAQGTVATSFEAQLAMHREEQERMEFEQGESYAVPIANVQGTHKKLTLEDIPDEELSEQELEEKYHYKPVKMFETEYDVQKRHNKFFEED